MTIAASRMEVPSTNRSFKPNGPSRPLGAAALPGLTLLEMTMVMLVLLVLLSTLFIGAQAWKRGSDRAMCIINIQSVQKGMRSYANLYNLRPGDNATNLKAQIIGPDRFVETSPACPGSGAYSFGQAFGEDIIPAMGTLYMECSLGPSPRQHAPNITPDW